MMRNLIQLLSVALLTIGLFSKASGQQAGPQARISGTIADSATLDSVPFATVSLKVNNTKTFKVAITQPNGYFEFTGVPTGIPGAQFHISITSAGYGSKIIPVDMSDTTRTSVDLGVITLAAAAKTLQAVQVTAEKPVVRQEIDRITYDLQADPESKSTSVLDMMRKVPFLSVDASGNILLKGSGNYRIFINGRPSGMLTNNPREVLRAMPASTIKRIEVITNPPVKYDAEGLAGIINIIMDKRTTDGTNGNVNFNGTFPQGGPGIGGSIALKRGKLGISAYGGGNLGRTPATSVIITRNTFTFPTALVQDGYVKSNNGTVYFGGELSYEIDSINLLTGSINLYANKTEGNNFQNSTLRNNSQILEQYSFDNKYDNKGDGIDASLNYQRGFKKDKAKLLTFSYNYRNNGSNQFNNIIIGDRVKYAEPDYQQFNEGSTAEQTGQIDFVQGKKNLMIEAGIKGIFRTNKSDYQHFARDSSSNGFEQVDEMSNQFRYTQNVYGVYNSYSYNLKRWSFKGGVRIEQTVIDADFTSTATKVHQNYVHAIPSVIAAYKMKGNSNLNVGFTRRIKRPNIYKLNPFVDRSNPNFEYFGNPELQPSRINTFMVGYGVARKVNLNAGIGYTFFNNLDFKVAEYDPATNITRTTFQNIGDGHAYNMDVNMNYAFTRRWNASLNSSIAFINADAENAGSVMKIDRFVYNINLSSAYKFDKGWRLNANLNVVGPNVLSFQAVSNSMVATGFTLSKEAMKGRLALSATVNNPFSKYRNNRITTTGDDFFETNVTREYFRSFGFSLNLRFGNLKEGIKKNKRGINNNDLGNNKGGL